MTDNDILKLNRLFAIKEDLNRSEDRIVSTVRKLYNDILDKMDTFITEVRNYLLEQTTHVQRHDDIEERISKVESVPVVAQELRRLK